MAFLLRTIRLDSVVLWIDEWGVLWLSDPARGLVETILTTLRTCFVGPSNEQMPFQYVLLNVFRRLYQALDWEVSAGLIRLPFAVLGGLSVLGAYRVARIFYGRRVAGWTLVLTGGSFFHVYQSRDATSYGALMFFSMVHLLGLAGWMVRRCPQLRHRIAFVAGAVGMLLTHMSAWFFLFVEGALLLARAIVFRVRRGQDVPWRDEVRGGRFEPAAWLLACAAPFLITLYRAATAYRAPEGDPSAGGALGAFLSYQLAHFGWGLGRGALILFGFALAGGLAALSRPCRRRLGMAHALLLVGPAVLLLLVPNAKLYPRYLTVSFMPLMMLAALGIAWLLGQLQRRFRLRRRWATGLAVAVFLLVAGLQAYPLWMLFHLRSKLMPTPQLVAWLESSLPEGGLYIWQSGYNLREVPQMYPVQGRQAAWATMHSGSIKAQAAAEKWGPFARDLFRRFPLAAFLATDFPEPPEAGPWAWIGTDFARREVVRNEELEALHRLGFSPHGRIYPANINVVCYYNRPDDLPDRLGASGFLVYPDGPGWRYLQAQDGRLFAAPERAARLRVHNLTGAAVEATLQLQAVAQAQGFLRLTAPEQMPLTRNFQPANQLNMEVGPFPCAPGPQDLRIEAWPADQAALLVYAARVGPAAEKKGE